MRATSGIAVSLVLVATAHGCSGSGGKSAADEFADRYCAEVNECCARALLPTDGQACHDWLVLYAQGGAYNAEAGKACLAQVASQASAGKLCTSLGESSPPSACESVYVSGTGNKQPGDSCRVTGDCATSNEGEVLCAVVESQGSRIAKCQVRVPGKAGDRPCVGTQEGDDFVPYPDTDAIDVEARAYVCNVADGDRCRFGTCTTMVAVGGDCGLTSDCVPDAFCNLDTKKCTARVAADGKCTGKDTSECVDGYFCASSSKQCTPKLANGASCSTSIMCKSDYCLNTVCDDDNRGLQQLCGT